MQEHHEENEQEHGDEKRIVRRIYRLADRLVQATELNALEYANTGDCLYI